MEIAAKLSVLQFNIRAKALAKEMGCFIRFVWRTHVCKKGNRRRKEQ